MRSLVRRPSEPSPDGLPWLILNVGGRTHETTDGAEAAELIASGLARPVRAFKSHSTSRSTPERPFIGRLGPHPDTESGLEGVHARLMSRQPTVLGLLPQCLWVGPPWNCPDFGVATSNAGLVIVEVKPRRSLCRPDVRSKLLRARSDLAALGLRYEVVSDLSEEAMWNFTLLSFKKSWQARWGPPVVEAAEFLVDLATTPTTVGRLWQTGVLPGARLKSLVWHLCWRGDLCVDWETRLGPKSTIRAHGPSCHRDTTSDEWRTVCGPQTPGLSEGEVLSR